jgi:Zn-dependent metalloprotease
MIIKEVFMHARATLSPHYCHPVHTPFCTIIPPYILKELSKRVTGKERDDALESLALSAQLRGQRTVASLLPAPMTLAVGGKSRNVYDARHTEDLPGKLIRSEGGKATKDTSANEAYNYAGTTYDFYKRIYGRNSVDDRGKVLDSTVHYGVDFDNAFWNGSQMVYGDGDGKIFQRFTKCLDVIGHELTHGVTQYEAGLNYNGQPGALNESFSDVFGILIKQWKLKQSASKADWIIGEGLFTKQIQGVGLRSMKAPGTAYDDPQLGKDPQPAHMRNYYKGSADHGGVHINSGIPNHAFYLTAVEIGGNAWEKAGKIWYVALRDRIRPTTNFKQAAQLLVAVAGELYGKDSAPQKAVTKAWKAVGVL